jgi:hypothetical protein
VRRKPLRRGAVFATVVGLGLTGLTAGSTLTAPIALAAGGSQECSTSHNSDTGHGANNDGGYQSTCDGSPSANGADETGNHTGEPCAGCVGNADDKNPSGQAPDGSDHNRGYECDANHGVGVGNPAHTGCEAGSEGENGGDNGGGGSGGSNPTTGGEVLGETLEAPVPGTPASGDVAGETVTAPAVQAAASTAPAQLAFTGVGTLIAVLAMVGSLLVLLGMVLVRASKEPAFA